MSRGAADDTCAMMCCLLRERPAKDRDTAAASKAWERMREPISYSNTRQEQGPWSGLTALAVEGAVRGVAAETDVELMNAVNGQPILRPLAWKKKKKKKKDFVFQFACALKQTSPRRRRLTFVASGIKQVGVGVVQRSGRIELLFLVGLSQERDGGVLHFFD